MRACFIDAPEGYDGTLGALPDGVRTLARPAKGIEFVQVFASSAKALERRLGVLRTLVAQDGMIWVSWPKASAAKSAGIDTDITEQTVRDIALPLGLVDVKVCAVDATWSGLKLVIRKSERAKREG